MSGSIVVGGLSINDCDLKGHSTIKKTFSVLNISKSVFLLSTYNMYNQIRKKVNTLSHRLPSPPTLFNGVKLMFTGKPIAQLSQLSETRVYFLLD